MSMIPVSPLRKRTEVILGRLLEDAIRFDRPGFYSTYVKYNLPPPNPAEESVLKAWKAFAFEYRRHNESTLRTLVKNVVLENLSFNFLKKVLNKISEDENEKEEGVSLNDLQVEWGKIMVYFVMIGATLSKFMERGVQTPSYADGVFDAVYLTLIPMFEKEDIAEFLSSETKGWNGILNLEHNMKTSGLPFCNFFWKTFVFKMVS